MDFLQLLFKRSKWFYAFLVLVSIINGFLNMSVLYFLNQFISRNPLMGFFNGYDHWVYTGAILVSLVLSRIFQGYLIHITNDIVLDFETSIFKKIKHANYESFENLGNERVYTAMNDARTLGGIPGVIMNSINSLIIVVCAFVYMSMISMQGTLILIGIMLVLLVIYLVRNYAIERSLNVLRDLQDHYYQYLNDLLPGYKEIKMDRTRSDSIFSDYIIKNRIDGKNIHVDTSIKYMNNELLGSYSWYVVIGVVLFVLPQLLSIRVGDLAVFIITILFIMGPIAALISIFPTYSTVKIAIERLTDFNNLLDRKLVMENADEEPESTEFGVLETEGITYKYKSDKRENLFHFGPVDFSINRNEIVFIVGGNGSGKSTFVKLLIGLYKPHQGQVLLDGISVQQENLKDYISVVFSEIHLFSHNYDGHKLSEVGDRLMELVELMKLQEVVSIEDDKTLIEPNLSTGQKKRLALIYALLEDKPILVMDEWAAEQDPEFRRYFYEVVLRELQKEGKTIIAITHDDKYFHVADRVVKFDYGQLIENDYKLLQTV